MAEHVNTDTAVTTRRPSWLPVALQTSLHQSMGNIATLLPRDIPVEHFRAALMLHLPQVTNLDKAQPLSVVSAIVKMAMQGMLPERDAAIVIFKGKAERLVFYQGLIRALDRTGRVIKAYAQVVYSNDIFEIDLGMDTLSHKPALGKPRGHILGAYAVILMKQGARHQHWMDTDDLNRVRTVALGRDQDAWVRHPTEMYRKTVLKNLCKYVQLTDDVDALLDEEDARPEASEVIIARGVQASNELFPPDPRQQQQGDTVRLAGEAREDGLPESTWKQEGEMLCAQAASVIEGGEATMTVTGITETMREITEFHDEHMVPNIRYATLIERLSGLLEALQAPQD